MCKIKHSMLFVLETEDRCVWYPWEQKRKYNKATIYEKLLKHVMF